MWHIPNTDYFLVHRVKISETKSDEGLTNLLEILQTETTDGAIYQCRAGNPYGADVYTVFLTILGNYVKHFSFMRDVTEGVLAVIVLNDLACCANSTKLFVIEERER